MQCAHCAQAVDRNNFEYIEALSLESRADLLDLTLSDLGIPKLHIVSVQSGAGDYQYYELTGDVLNVMPQMAAKGRV